MLTPAVGVQAPVPDPRLPPEPIDPIPTPVPPPPHPIDPDPYPRYEDVPPADPVDEQPVELADGSALEASFPETGIPGDGEPPSSHRRRGVMG